MSSYLAVAVTIIVAFYTAVFGWEILKTKNYGGFIAVLFLAAAIVGLPVYMLFFKG